MLSNLGRELRWVQRLETQEIGGQLAMGVARSEGVAHAPAGGADVAAGAFQTTANGEVRLRRRVHGRKRPEQSDDACQHVGS